VRATLLLLVVLAGCSPERAPAPPPPPAAGHHYESLFGRRYRTKVDLYLFGDEGIERQYVGRTAGRFKILDVVPAGAELTILAETHEVTAASGIREKEGYPMGFICRLRYAGKQVEPVMAELIQAAEHAPPGTPNQRIDEAIATWIEE
jgi:hypothetical protein